MDIVEMKAQVIKMVDDYCQKAYQKFGVSLGSISIEWFDNKLAAGFCSVYRNRLMFNTIIMQNNWDDFEEVIAHEVSHLIVPKVFPNHRQAHGPEFRRVMRAFGFEGRTYHSLNTEGIAKRTRKSVWHVMQCSTCKTDFKISQIAMNRFLKGRIGFSCHCGCKTFHKTGVITK